MIHILLLQFQEISQKLVNSLQKFTISGVLAVLHRKIYEIGTKIKKLFPMVYFKCSGPLHGPYAVSSMYTM